MRARQRRVGMQHARGVARAPAGSCGGTRKPVTPSTTEYWMPPTALPITGVPQAIASSGVMPNGSYHGVVTNTSAAA